MQVRFSISIQSTNLNNFKTPQVPALLQLRFWITKLDFYSYMPYEAFNSRENIIGQEVIEGLVLRKTRGTTTEMRCHDKYFIEGVDGG